MALMQKGPQSDPGAFWFPFSGGQGVVVAAAGSAAAAAGLNCTR